MQHMHNHDDAPLGGWVDKLNEGMQPDRVPKDSVLPETVLLIEFVGLVVAFGGSILRLPAPWG
ncbi:hypothetical protein [Variovorax soli]|uniref:Uncharacterized protein n=1 Tax=Variovorax soli TaxID=376815 RepID=A0ABU1NMM3_9BURK|nr:hypothetical protein [Variovorax soli]MDR6539695.1 hypothetical protein [Variovorax soli]